MTPLKLAMHRVMPNSEALWINDKELWTSVNYIIYYTEALDAEPQKIANLKTPFLTKELSKLRLATRALRLGVRSFLRLRNGTIIVVANKRLFRLNENKLSLVHMFDRGIGPLRNGLCEDQKGNVYAGEYFLNTDRAYPVKLLKSMDDGKTWDVGVGKALDKIQVSFSRDRRYLESFKVVLKNVYKWSCDNKENIDKSAGF